MAEQIGVEKDAEAFMYMPRNWIGIGSYIDPLLVL